MAYDDLMGLDMYDGLDGVDDIYSARMFQDQIIAAASSGVAILLASWSLPKLTAEDGLFKNLEEQNRHRVGAILGIILGGVAGRIAWNRNRDVGMAIVGGVSGLGIAQLIDSFIEKQNLIGGGDAKMYPLGSFGALPEDTELSASDQALLAAYDQDNAGALSALEAANVQASRGAFGETEGTVVHPEQLMGFGGLDAAVVAAQTLGEEPYPGYLV
ncbi:MAG: hypothetical protein ACE5F6_00295 [Anaerolineae bacterium]